MYGIIKPLVAPPLKHLFKMMTNPEYFTCNRLWSQLSGIKRYQECSVKVNDWQLSIPDNLSFLYSYKEIFVDKIYAFDFDKPSPRILDLGSNIGLSVLFFKSLYPEAKITGYEADPVIYKYLTKNVFGNGYTDVRLIDKAIWHENTTLDFSSEGADAGRVDIDSGNVKVEAIDILEILKEQEFDYLKMDIEGAEEYVLPRCRELLSNLKFIFIEYHSRVNKEQNLNEILSILKDAGFRTYLRNINDYNLSPFTEVKTLSGFDLQLNIFAQNPPLSR
jgi:FkbM family methyltransferase